MNKTILTAATISMLAGCGGGGGSDDPFSFTSSGSGPLALSDFTQFQNVSSNSLGAPVFGAPNAASASYNGIVQIVDPSRINVSTGSVEYLMGRATLNADFTNGTMSGSSGDFSNVTVVGSSINFDNSVSGSIPFTNGAITGEDWTAQFNGTLNDAGETIAVATAADGKFATLSGQNIILGTLDGTMSRNGATATDISGGVTAFE